MSDHQRLIRNSHNKERGKASVELQRKPHESPNAGSQQVEGPPRHRCTLRKTVQYTDREEAILKEHNETRRRKNVAIPIQPPLCVSSILIMKGRMQLCSIGSRIGIQIIEMARPQCQRRRASWRSTRYKSRALPSDMDDPVQGKACMIGGLQPQCVSCKGSQTGDVW